jgi:hypothetical protein
LAFQRNDTAEDGAPSEQAWVGALLVSDALVDLKAVADIARAWAKAMSKRK